MATSLKGFGATGNLIAPANTTRPPPVHQTPRPTGHPALSPTTGSVRPPGPPAAQKK